MIPAKEWREKNVKEILESIEVALRVIEYEKEMDEEDKKYLIYIIKQALDLCCPTT